MRTTTFRSAATAIAFLAAAATLTAAPAQADTGTTYFVDNRASTCSDEGPGTDAAAPWCGFGPAASLALGEGDRLLLARGASFAEQLVVDAPHGSASHRAEIGAYGTGDAPRFVANGTNAAVVIRNADHTVVSDLDIGGIDESIGRGVFHYGIRFDYTTLGHTDATIERIDVRDSRTVGIFVRNTADHEVADTAIDGITVRDITTSHNAHGIVFASQGKLANPTGAGTVEETANRIFRNVLVEGIRQKDDDNNNPPPDDVQSQIDAGCPDSLAISAASDVIVRDSVLDGSAGCRTKSGTAALYLGSVRDVVVANNMFINTPNTQNPDMVAIDHEARTHNVVIAGNYFADNFGGGIEYLAIHGANDYSTQNQIRANTFMRNGYQNYIPYIGGGSIAQVGSGPAPESYIADNLAFEPYGFVAAHLGGTTAGLELENNLQLEDEDWVSHAAADLGADGSAWSHQHHPGNDWLPLPGGGSASNGSNAAATTFTLKPGSNADVAVAWTAPRDGVVALRGFPMAVSDSSKVRVTVDGESVAETEVDARGEVVSVDDLAVAAGQVVRFEALAGQQPVSWTPAVSYVSGPVEDEQGQWRFTAAGDAQGWTATNGETVTAGTLVTSFGSGTMSLTSPDGLGLEPANAVRVSLGNTSDVHTGTLYYRAPGEDFDAEHSVRFHINPHEVRGLAQGLTDVVIPIDTAGMEAIDQLRFDLGGGTGRLTVGSIEVIDQAGPRWEFDAPDGWTINPDLSRPGQGIPAADPVVDVDNSEGAFGKVADIRWTHQRRQTFQVSTGTLARLDLWTYKSGAPQGDLFLTVTDQDGKKLFTGSVSPDQVTTAGGFVSIHPGLTGLDPNASYAVDISSPYTVPNSGSYGVGYNDRGLYPAGTESYSIDAGGTWKSEAWRTRSLRFSTYSADEVAQRPADAGFEPVTVAGGVVSAATGYEPALLSPGGLNVDAAELDTIHIRMSNPDNRHAAYLLFSTTENPEFDTPGTGDIPMNEEGRRGVTIPLVPGAEYVDYEIDMSSIPGWDGTIEQLMVQPLYRWNYRIGPQNSTWHGAIGWIYLDEGSDTR